jgi:hypothetical protein
MTVAHLMPTANLPALWALCKEWDIDITTNDAGVLTFKVSTQYSAETVQMLMRRIDDLTCGLSALGPKAQQQWGSKT